MVQYKRPWSQTLAKDYWKLDHASQIGDAIRLLNDRGIAYDSAWPDARLYTASSRAQRGLLIYDNCTTDELALFCSRRGVKISANNPAREQLIFLLEHADDTDGLHCFNVLPNELKIDIYEHHIRSLEPDCIPSQPPLTQVSRHARKEALPLFYRLCKFYSEVTPRNGQTIERGLTGFLDVAPASAVERIQKLEVSGFIYVRNTEYHNITFWLGTPTLNLRHGPGLQLTPQQDRELSQRLSRLLEHFRSRSPRLRLANGDVGLLGEVFMDMD